MKRNAWALPEGIKTDVLERFIKLNRRSIAVYSIISVNPPIFYVPIFGSKIDEFAESFQTLFEYLKGRRAIFLFVHYASVLPHEAKAVIQLEEQHRRRYPDFRFIHLCNVSSQLERLGSGGCETYFCNQNAMVDERLYLPLANVDKKYDAVYDARLLRYKRHHLAARLKSLGLIYYSVLIEDEMDHMSTIKNEFGHARFFNHNEAGEYHLLTPREVNRALNQCRVGLCLSAQEGAMYASVQYLLAGLPVVTTPSFGGRDVFFDDEIAITVEPTPEAVESGVREMIRRNIAAEYIRERTLKRMKVHRKYFVDLIQNIYRQEGITRDFSAEWGNIFFNKLVKNQKHVDTIRQLKSLD